MRSNFFKIKSVLGKQDKYTEQLTSSKICFMIAGPFSLFYNAFNMKVIITLVWIFFTYMFRGQNRKHDAKYRSARFSAADSNFVAFHVIYVAFRWSTSEFDENPNLTLKLRKP